MGTSHLTSAALQLNILVSSSCRAIITDFGSSRALSNVVQHVVDQENVPDASGIPTMDKSADCRQLVIIATSDELTLTGPAWSLRWAAPEVIKEEEQPSLPSDIWSAGWVCWEVSLTRIYGLRVWSLILRGVSLLDCDG